MSQTGFAERTTKRKRKMLKLESSSAVRDRTEAARRRWVYDILKSRKEAEFEIVDIEDYKLPLLDEPVSPGVHQYSKSHTKTWTEKIALLDATFSSPPNTTMPLGGFKDAIDFLFTNGTTKRRICRILVALAVSSGRELEAVMGEIKIADVQAQVALSMFSDFENFTTFKPHEHHDKAVHLMATK